jgi:cytochrome P450
MPRSDDVFRKPGKENEAFMARALPPRHPGLPYVGDTIPLLTNTLAYVTAQRRRYGDLWGTQFIGQRAAVAIGAEAQRQILVNNAQFPAAPGYEFVKPLLGHSLFDMDGDEHTYERRAMTPAFLSSQHAAYLTRLEDILEKALSRWGEAGERVFYRDALAVMFTFSCAITIGIDASPQASAADQGFMRHWLAMQGGLLNPIRLDVVGLPWRRSLAARRWLERYLLALIAQRRAASSTAAPPASADMLDLLLQAQQARQNGTPGEGAAPLSDRQIVDHIILLLFAGYETTAGAVSWLLIELLRQPPQILARVREEVHADDHDAPITLEEIKKTPYLDAVIKETLRLHPAQHVSIRGVSMPWLYAGRVVPAGWSVMIAPMYTHRMPEYFADPERFDPARFLPPREEDRAHPYALVEFGGGAHSCLGSGIAKLVMKAMVTKVLRRYELALVPEQDFTPVFIPAGRPRGGARVCYAQVSWTADGAGLETNLRPELRRATDVRRINHDGARRTRQGPSWTLLGVALVAGALAVALVVILLKRRRMGSRHITRMPGV